MNDRRLGKFSVSRHAIEQDPTAVQRIMSRCIVVRAEMLWEKDAVSYVAISGLFSEVPCGEVTPEYHIWLDADYNITAERLP